jgi:transketolase
MLIYSLLHLSGYDLTERDIEDFRQWGSRTPGHPEYGHTPGVETTTGPLGQGVANSVGMALAERWLAARFNRPEHTIVDHHTWVFCSDGDLQEGISHEAASLAGHHRLGKLTWVFDDNRITIDGGTDLSCSTDHEARFRAYGWHVQSVEDGEDLEAIDRALRAAKEETDRPSFIRMRTVIGYSSPTKAGSSSAHGAPLGDDEITGAKANLDYPSQKPFWVAPEAREAYRAVAERGRELEREWKDRFDVYRREFPEDAGEFLRTMSGELPLHWRDGLGEFDQGGGVATRVSSGKALQNVAAVLPELVGGSADLAGSNKTDIAGGGDLLPENPGGRIVHFGIREHAMGAIMNGMSLHGGLRPFGGTFLIFSDYMRPAIRLASLMGQPTIYVFTHDSIGLGEDGPTHQPIEQLMALRSIPGLQDLRPADAAETAAAWIAAIERRDGPSFLALTRQGVPALERTAGVSAQEGLLRGGYVLAEAEGGPPSVTIIASGSEVQLAVEARHRLQAEGEPTRVVSLPSWYRFGRQDEAYRRSVIPETGLRVSIEAGVTLGWGRWIGSDGLAIGIDHFGASAPWQRLFDEYGLTAGAVAERALERLRSRQGTPTPA